MSEKLHLKPSPLNFCFSCGHFEWSHDQFTTILSLRPKLAKNGRKVPQMTEIGLNVWKVTSETISIGFLLLLRSFWVVTWLVCNNFEFGAKIGQKWPKKALNDQKKGLKVWKWHPKPSPSDSCFSCGHFEWSHDYSATILNLRPKLAKMAKNDRKRPKMTKNGLNVCNMTEIDWFDVVTALKGQFWVSVLTSSSSEAGPAKNLNFGTVKNFSWNAATDHISSFSFTQSA